MEIVNWYTAVLQKYAVFTGRARRKEYWMFFLGNLTIAVVLTILSNLISLLAILSVLYSLAVIIPGIAVGVRRLHDIGKSGFWILITLIPLIGVIWIIILLAKEGDRGENPYGSDPKMEASI